MYVAPGGVERAAVERQGRGGRDEKWLCLCAQLSGNGRKRIRVREFKGYALVDLREYFEAKGS